MCITHILHVESHAFLSSETFFYFGVVNKYLRLALPLLFFCVLTFLGWGGCCTASFTASSQKPMLEFWVSPQILLGSEPQLVLVFTDPHTELLRDVCDESDIRLLMEHTFPGLQVTITLLINLTNTFPLNQLFGL